MNVILVVIIGNTFFCEIKIIKLSKVVLCSVFDYDYFHRQNYM